MKTTAFQMTLGVWQVKRKTCTKYALSFCLQLLYVILRLLVILQNPADGDSEHSSRLYQFVFGIQRCECCNHSRHFTMRCDVIYVFDVWRDDCYTRCVNTSRFVNIHNVIYGVIPNVTIMGSDTRE